MTESLGNALKNGIPSIFLIIPVFGTESRELTIRQGLAPRRQTWQRVDWIEYFVFRANFDRYERAHAVRSSLAGTSRPHTNCCC